MEEGTVFAFLCGGLLDPRVAGITVVAAVMGMLLAVYAERDDARVSVKGRHHGNPVDIRSFMVAVVAGVLYPREAILS